MINKNALGMAGMEAAIETVKLIPGISILIEGVRKSHETMEEEQKDRFVRELESKLREMGSQLTEFKNAAPWYTSEEGKVFVTKVVSTALNAEHADKVEYLANSLINGPSLGSDQARRLKYAESIRALSKPSMDVLAASLKTRAAEEGYSSQIETDDIAKV